MVSASRSCLPLSAVTAPIELILDSIEQRKDSETKRLGRLYLQEMKRLEQDQNQYNLIDIVQLPTADQIRAGTVPITATCGSIGTLYYTPEDLCPALKEDYPHSETHEDYHFVPLEGQK